MSAEPDPFRHHPEMRDRIVDPATSEMRAFTSERIRQILRDNGINPDKALLSDVEREASRQRFLDSRPPGDLWVFGYGSLMWNPAFHFAEVRQAHAPGYARKMLIKDTLGGRGTRAAPGMIAALDLGEGCDGLAFRIVEDLIEEETGIIWMRERSVPGYHTHLIPLETAQGPINALAFVADHAAPIIDGGLTRDEVVKYIATGRGFLGSSLDYVAALDAGLRALGMEDPYITDLLRAAQGYCED